ncbi:unnamed protein product [Cunninghamella blakesleeana]
MEKENDLQNLDSAIASDIRIEKHSIIQVESVSNHDLNNTSTNNELVTTPTTTTTHSTSEAINKKKRNLIMTFIALQVSLFLSALDTTIVSTILPNVGSEFNQMNIVSWVATAYLLTFDAFQPLFAKFSDIFGRKWTLITAISIFLIGSLLCGVSTTMITLIISRAVAGIGAAGISSGVNIVIAEIIPLEKRGSYQGIVNAVWALSGVMGPLLGKGTLTDHVTWRWCFYINLPIGGIAILLLFFFLDLPTQKSSLKDKLKRIDYLGTIIFLAAALLLLLALNFGGQFYPWVSAAVLVPLIFSFIFIILFVIVEYKFAKEPIVPLRLFRNRTFTGALFINWWFGFTFFSFIYYIPIYFQVVKGDGAMWAGIRILPLQMVTVTLSFSVGYFISKFQVYRPFIWVGSCLLTLHIGLVILFDVDTNYSTIYIINTVGAIGMGSLFTATNIGIQASVDHKDVAVCIGLGNFSRLLGAAVGVAISGTILNSELSKNLPTVLPPEYVDIVIEKALFIYHGLPEQYKSNTIQVYCNAIRMMWYIITPLTSFTIIGSVFIKHYNLRQHNQEKKIMIIYNQ